MPQPIIESSLAPVMDQPQSDEAKGRCRPTVFLENKSPNHRRVADLLRISERANHWANGGPVSRLLEKSIAEITYLHRDKVVVMCASGTAALNVLARLHAMKLGHSLRWAVAGYSFFSSFIGPFAGSITVDCDETGMLDLDALSSLLPDSYEGVCVTNLFGLQPDLRRYEEFCREKKKILIVDNAQGFFLVDRTRRDCPDEMISFHHTKPWGFGEGGCVIVSREDEAAVRSIINFGVFLPYSAAPFVFNGKMSDVSAAYILDRLERIPNWLPRYEKQWHRISEIAQRARVNLRPFPSAGDRFAGIGHVPLLASRPVGVEQLENDCFVVRKYYRPPPEPNLTRARELFARVINVPCHNQMARVPAKAIKETLRQILTEPG